MPADTYTLTCPRCGRVGGDVTMFGRSLSDECYCPECGVSFAMGYEDEIEEDDQ